MVAKPLKRMEIDSLVFAHHYFFNYNVDADQKSKEIKASAALLGLLMLMLGPGRVAAEGLQSIS